MNGSGRVRAGGFTLVETLIGTTLLAVMMGILTTSLFSLGSGARSGESRLSALDSERLSRAFLREQLADARPLTLRDRGSERVFFEGNANSVRFVGHLPAHRGGGGLQFIELAVDRAARRDTLVLRFLNAWTDVAFSSADADHVWEVAELVSDVGDIRFRYFGHEDDTSDPRWENRWVDRDRLPSLVEVTIDSAESRGWPPISVALRAQTAAGQSHLYRAPRE